MEYLINGEHPEGASPEERLKVEPRAGSFKWEKGRLLREVDGEERRVVPAPDERQTLVMNLHTKLGQWGEGRTIHTVQGQYWWPKLATDVREVLKNLPGVRCPSQH